MLNLRRLSFACGVLAALGATFLLIQNVLAQDTKSGTETNRLADTYSGFAGSDANAQSLITGLRTSSDITLTASDGTSSTFKPATGKLGFGNINIALSLAKKELADQGITQPTPDQLQAALNGGSVKTSTGTTVMLPGILELRAEGKGWGQIANSMGIRLGDVVSASHTDRSRAGDRPEKGDRPERAERAERPERVARPERPVR